MISSELFQTGSLFDRVYNTYKLMHTHQTLDFVKQKVSEEEKKQRLNLVNL